MKKFIFTFIFILINLLFVCSGMTQTATMDVTLRWDSNTEPDLLGYRVYWDTDSGVPYTNYQAVGPTDDENPNPDLVEYTVKGLSLGVRYYFVVTAFDNESPSLESGYSNEVSTDGITGQPPTVPELILYRVIIVFEGEQ